MRFTAFVLFAAAVAIFAHDGKAQTVTLEHTGNSILVANHAPVAIEAMDFRYLVDGRPAYHQICFDPDGPWLAAGASLELPAYRLSPRKYAGKDFTLELASVAFSDGTGAGGAWASAFVQMKAQMAAAQVVRISSDPEAGNGRAAFDMLWQAYREAHPNAVVKSATEDTATPYPYIVPGTWSVYSYATFGDAVYPINPVIDQYGNQTCVINGWPSPGSIACNGTGSCPTVNFYQPGKEDVDVAAGPSSSCQSLVYLTAYAGQLYGNEGPPVLPLPYLAYEAGATSYVNWAGTNVGQYSIIDICTIATPEVYFKNPMSGPCPGTTFP